MADFRLFLSKLDANEGGYANDPRDIGGETYRGIARKFHPTWPGWARIDAEKRAKGGTLPNNYRVKDAALDAAVDAFYKATFWDVVGGDRIRHQPLAELFADSAVGGIPLAVKMMQRTLRSLPFRQNVAVDGKVGPQTLNAMNAVDARQLHNVYKEARRSYYLYRVGQLPTSSPWYTFFIEIGKKVATDQVVFLNSWLRRLDQWPDFILEHKAAISGTAVAALGVVLAVVAYKLT